MQPQTLVELLILHVYLTTYIWPLKVVGHACDAHGRIMLIYIRSALPPDALTAHATMALAGIADVAPTGYHKHFPRKREWLSAIEVHVGN